MEGRVKKGVSTELGDRRLLAGGKICIFRHTPPNFHSPREQINPPLV